MGDEMAELIEFPNGNLNDIPGMLRKLADRIETGDLQDATTAFVIIPVEDDWPRLVGYGDIDGRNDPLIQCDLLRHWLITNLTTRG